MKQIKALSLNKSGRVFRSGVLSTAILVAAIVIAILINLLVNALPSKYTEFDLSEGGLYTLGDTSVQLVQGLEADVKVYYLCETGSEDTIVSKLLDRYAAESSHFSWEEKDPAVYPTFAAQYGAQNSQSGSLIVTCGEQSVVLDASELYTYDYSNYYTTGTVDTQFDGENQITSAIYRLTSGEKSHAYYITNHGEQILSDSLVSALESQNIDVEALNLLSDTIPDDCDLLIINNPTSDYSDATGVVDEISMLASYLENGGKMLLMTDAYYSTAKLDALMEEFGLSRTQGLVVESDAGHTLQQYGLYLLPDYGTTSECTALDGIDSSANVLLQMAHGITITESDDITAETLLETTDSAYSKVAGYDMTTIDKEDGDIDGPISLAVWARSDTTGAEVIWIGCANIDNEYIYQSIPGNLKFLQGCSASLAGQSTSILIETKSLEASPITVNSSVAAALGLVFVFVLPALTLIVGVIVVILRRRK